MFFRAISKALKLKKLEARIREHRLKFEREIQDVLQASTCLNVHIRETTDRILGLGASESGIAIVSPLPPEDTGVSTVSFQLAKEVGGRIDLFTQFRSVGDYYGTLVKLDGAAELFPNDMLPVLAKRRQYHTIIFAIANSHHIVPTAQRLLALRKLGFGGEIVAQVHDPVLFGLARRLMPWDELNRRCRIAYPRLGGKRFTDATETELLDARISAFGALFGNQVDRVIVHSKAARDIILDDMREMEAPHLDTLFLPISEDWSRAPMPLKSGLSRPAVGCFGVPGREKYTDEILAAARTMLRSGTIGTFIFAGFGAGSIDSMISDHERATIRLFDAPNDEELSQLMSEVDVAVQLRRRNLGESSGVFPQLLNKGKSIVASRIGSFLDYEGLVTYCDAPIDSASICRAVEKALVDDPGRRTAISAYAASHRMKEFFDQIVCSKTHRVPTIEAAEKLRLV